MSRAAKILFPGLILFTLLVGLGCKSVPRAVTEASKPTTLNVWGVFDDEDAYRAVIADYRATHPYVQVQYRKFRPEEYEKELVNALSEDKGPDIFMIHNTWTDAWQSKIEPLPETVQLAELVTSGTVKKEQAYELHRKNTLSLRAIQTLFPDQVATDAVRQTAAAAGASVPKIYGLPLSIDTLVLYWNRELLNAAGIALPPATWPDFQQAVKKLVKLDQNSAVIQAGAGLGTEKNVERASDILALLMMQNGTEMIDENGSAAFHQMPPGSSQAMPPGWQATIFYTDFANPTKEVYNWNDTLPNNLDAFVTGQSAMFLGYSYHLPLVRARAPKLKFGISPAPQIDPAAPTNYANYWLYTVSKKSKQRDLAWDFILTMTSAGEAKKYLAATGRPTALRSLIGSQLEDIDLGVFAHQILTARSWYRGYDVGAAERALRDLIDQTLAGDKIEEATNVAAQKVQQTLRPPQ